MTEQKAHEQTGIRARLLSFFWAETEGEAAALFRIGFGLLVSYYLAIHVGLNLDRYYGEAGVLPHAVFVKWVGHTSLLALSGSSTLLWAVWAISLLAAITLTLGYRARISAAVLYVGLVSIQNRNPFVSNAAETLITALAFLSIFAPLSLRASLDARVRPGGGGRNLGLRLIQLQIVIVYVTSVWHKLQSPAWRSGEALHLAMKAQTVSRLPEGLGSPAIERALTFGTLALEGLFFLVFWRRLRPVFLVGGLLLHLTIEATFTVPMFSATMLISYLAFLTDAEAKRVWGWVRPSR